MPHGPIGPTPKTNPVEKGSQHKVMVIPHLSNNVICAVLRSVECIDSLSGPESQRNWRENTWCTYELTRLKSRYRIASFSQIPRLPIPAATAGCTLYKFPQKPQLHHRFSIVRY